MASGIEIARAFVLARRRSGWSPEQLRAHQRKHLEIDGCPIETSIQFEDHFAERNALGLTIEQARSHAERELAGQPSAFPGFSWGLSTGTMGRAGLFLTSERERNTWLGTVLGKFLPLRMLAGSDVALVLKHNNRLYTEVRKTRGLRLHYFDAATPVAGWVSELCCLAPAVLIGPPCVLEQVALSQAFARLPVRPQLLLAGAEPLFPQDRAFLELAYGVAPRVIYQAKEGFLAAGCRKGGIHLNEDLIYFERLLLERSRFVPVITDFMRTSQRYRRFRLDDVLIADAVGCSCNQCFARVSAVEGRAQDVLLFENERIFPLEINELIQGRLAPSERPRDYRVTQVTPDRLTVAVEGGTPFEVAEALARLGRSVQVSVEDYQAPVPGEKRRRVRRLFDLHNDWLNRLTVSRNAPPGL
jgi:putative adenylate-forming enzyme